MDTQNHALAARLIFESLSIASLWILAGLALSNRLLPTRLSRLIGWLLIALCLLLTGIYFFLVCSRSWEIDIRDITSPGGFWIVGMMLIGTYLVVSSGEASTKFLSYLGYPLMLILLCSVLVHSWGYDILGRKIVYSFSGYYRPSGLFYSPLEAGLGALVGWGMGLALSFNSKAKYRWFGYFLTCLSTAIVYLTLSRSAWLGLGIAVLMGVVWAVKSSNWRLLPALGGTVGMFLLCSLAMPIGWGRTAYAFQNDPSVQNRLVTWRELPQMVFTHPFGVPYTGKMPSMPKMHWRATFVNAYFDLLVYFGLLPIFSFLWVLGILLRRSWKSIAQGGPHSSFGLAFFATLICLFFMSPYWDSLTCVLWGGLWGVVAGLEGSDAQ